MTMPHERITIEQARALIACRDPHCDCHLLRPLDAFLAQTEADLRELAEWREAGQKWADACRADGDEARPGTMLALALRLCPAATKAEPDGKDK
jgi:hypothetical protein